MMNENSKLLWLIRFGVEPHWLSLQVPPFMKALAQSWSHLNYRIHAVRVKHSVGW